MLKKLSALTLALLILAAPLLSSAADIRQTAIDDSLTYLIDVKPHFDPDSPDEPKFFSSVWSNLVLSVTDNIDNEELSFLKLAVNVANLNSESTANDFAAAIITLYAEGQNPTSISSRNLADELAALIMNNGKINDDVGIFELAMAVLALEMAGNTKYDKNAAVEFFRGGWLAEGGFNDFGDEGDVDTTSIVIMALAAIRTADASDLIKKSLEFLKSLQQDDGFFLAKGEYASKNSASQSMAILALTAAAEKLSDWDKNGKSVTDALLTLAGENGGFWYTVDDKNGTGYYTIPDDYSTNFSILALNAAIGDKTVFDVLLPLAKYTKPPVTAIVPPSSAVSDTPVPVNPNPVTGDEMKLLPWIIIIILAVIALAAVIFLGKGKKK